MRELMVFEGKELEVLTKEDVNFEFNGEVLFNGRQVAEILEYKRPSDAISDNVRSDSKFKIKNSDTVNYRFRKLNNAGEYFITERGVMKLIIGSTMPKADEFEDKVWEIISEVQKTGRYDVAEQKIKQIEDEEERNLTLAIYQLGNYVQANPTDIIASVNLTTKKNELTTYKQGKELERIKGEVASQSKRIENFTVIGDRKQFTNEVNSVARATGKQQNEIYGLAYKELEDEYGISLEQRSKNLQRKIQNERLDQGKKPLAKSTLEARASKLNVADEEGLWNELGKSLFVVKNRMLGL